MLNRYFFRHWFNWYAFLSPIWVGVILFNEFICWRNWSPQDWAAWVGSIGTILAFAGTIYLASTETRRRERIEHGRLLVEMPDLQARLDSKIAGVETVIGILTQANNNRDARPSTRACATILENGTTWYEEELAAFLVLEEYIAYRLVRSETGITRARSKLHWMNNDTTAEDFFIAYGPVLNETINFLIQAMRDLLQVQKALEDLIPDI